MKDPMPNPPDGDRLQPSRWKSSKHGGEPLKTAGCLDATTDGLAGCLARRPATPPPFNREIQACLVGAWGFLTPVLLQGGDVEATPKAIDMGLLFSGDKITNMVSLVNHGSKDHVVRIAGQCSCLTFSEEWWLPAGASGQIPFIFDSAGRSGLFQEMVHFYWEGGSTRVELTGFVKPRVLLMPVNVNTGILPVGAVLHTNLTLKIGAGELSNYAPLVLKTAAGIDAQLMPGYSKDTQIIHLKVPSQIFELGAWTNQLALEILSHDGQMLATLVLSGDIERPFTIHPRILAIGTGKASELELRFSEAYRHVALLKVEESSGALKAEVLKSSGGKWLVRVSIADMLKIQTDHPTILSVFTDLPCQSVWRVPMRISLSGRM